MAGETLDFKITVEAQQAQVEVAKFNGKLSEVESSAKKASAAIAKIERPSAVAATSTRNVGMAALETSRALEDMQYGLSGVVNNIPSLVMALGGGMGLTAAISLAAVGVNQIVKNFNNVDPATKTATDTAKEYVKDLKKEISSLSDELDKLQGTATKTAMREQATRIELAAIEAQALIDKVGGRVRLDLLETMTQGGTRMDLLMSKAQYMAQDIVYRTRNPFVSPELLQQALDAREKLDLEMSKLAGMARIEQEKEDQKRIDDAVDVANAITEAEKKGSTDRIANAKKEADEKYKIFVSYMEEEEKQLREARKASDKRRKEQDELELQRMGMSLASPLAGGALAGAGAGTQGLAGAQSAMQEMAVQAAKNAAMAEDWSLAWKKAGDSVAESLGGATGAMTTGIGIAVDGIQQLTTDVITGQEHATERLGALVMSQAGQALIGSGTKLAGEAVVSAFTPGLQPLAVTQGVAAAGLIAAGIGLGGIATGIEHMAAGGTLGKPLPDKTGKDRGAAPRSSRGSGDGGPLVINVSYGVGGPLPEDTAREIARVMRTGNRRRGAA